MARLIGNPPGELGRDLVSGAATREFVVRRRIDYGDPDVNDRSAMTIPAGTLLYHATKPAHVTKIRGGIDVNASTTTQLGKGFYTSWFSAGMEDYGSYVVRFRVGRQMDGQQVYSDEIAKANQREKAASRQGAEAERAVKQPWDIDNDFLYTPRLDEKVDEQNVPHQVKVTARGVNALPVADATVIDTARGTEGPIADFVDPTAAEGRGLGGLGGLAGVFADIRKGRK